MSDKYLHTGVADRRRTWRRRLQRPASVTVRPPGPADRRGAVADMLNLSEQGLACRMETRDANRLPVGPLLTVSYTLPVVARPLVCPARIVNITPCGDPVRSIVGMEFVFSNEHDDQRRELRRALDRIMDGSEVSSTR